jgi:flagellar basal body rod protein FlgG
MNPISSAFSGMTAAFARFERAATSLADLPNAASPEQDMVDLIEAKLQAKASAAVIRTADDMLGAILDIRA